MIVNIGFKLVDNRTYCLKCAVRNVVEYDYDYDIKRIDENDVCDGCGSLINNWIEVKS
jgi:hypothetical protein